MLNKFIISISIVCLLAGLVVRLTKLESVPPHLSNDEISIAYDAYSMVKTGRDEHGHLFPISFQSHGSYKAPLYSYLLAPLTLILPHTDTTAKLPSAAAGLLTILVISLTIYKLSKNRLLSLLAGLIMTTSPWHIYTSHMVLETNLALLFTSLSVLLFVSGYFNLTAVFLSLSMYAYHTQWGLAPLLAIYFFQNIFKNNRRSALTFLITFFVFSFPLAFDYLSLGGTSARANVEMIWNDPQVNSALSFLTTFISNYFSYTNPGYLFFSGLSLFPSPHPYNPGLFVWPLIIPYFVGLMYLFKNLKLKPGFKLILYWFLISPIVPALTHGGNSLLRNLPSILPYTLTIALGWHQLFLHRKVLFTLTLSAYLIFVFLYSWVYLFHFPVETAATYHGYKPIAQYLNSHPGFAQVRIDDRFGIDNQFSGVPHLYFAYFNYLNPALLQNRQFKKDATYYGNVAITWINWANEPLTPSTWYVTSVGNRPAQSQQQNLLQLVSSFPDAGGRPAFEIWTTK